MRALIHALCCSDRRSRGPFTSESLALHVFTFHSSRSGIPPEYHRQDVIYCHTLLYSAKQLPGNVLMFSMRFVWSLTCYFAANMLFDACWLMHQLQAVRAGEMCMSTCLCTCMQACKREAQCCCACFRQYQQGCIWLHTCPATEVFS